MLKQTDTIKSPLLVKIHVDDLPIAWPMAKHWVDEAMSGSLYATSETVKAKLDSDHAQMWLVWDDEKPSAVVITQLNLSERGKYCSIWVCVGGGREGSQHLLDVIEQWAAHEGCKFMRFEARTGWSRALKPQGYAQSHVILEKVL